MRTGSRSIGFRASNHRTKGLLASVAAAGGSAAQLEHSDPPLPPVTITSHAGASLSLTIGVRNIAVPMAK